MPEIKIVVRTADQTRKAELEVDSSLTGADLIEGCIGNWSLPTDTDYSLVSVTSGKTIPPSSTLADSGLTSGDVIDIQPVLVAGHHGGF